MLFCGISSGAQGRRIIDGRGAGVDKRKLKWLTWGIVLFVVLAVGLILSGTLRRSTHITLPIPATGQRQDGETLDDSSDVLTLIEVTPETVQAVVETLKRPQAYQRAVTVEQFWSSGSGSYEVSVTVSGEWTRTDRTMPDGRIRHTLTGPDRVYIWYNSSIYSSPVGETTADAEQFIPTYEEILRLQPEQILTADEREVSGLHCIYVETVPDELGYTLRYWVDLNTGLLVMAEELQEGATVYRMAALSVEENNISEDSFRLPDGTLVLDEPAE